MNRVDPALVEALRRSGYSEEGFAARYDANRPRPPAVLLDLLPFVAGVEQPALVVDLGSGTGLSTRFWAESARSVVGVEPNPEMRRFAERATSAANVTYVGTASHATGLADGCADIVTCAQSLQWMEPEPTFAEVTRILRPDGVLAAYQYESLVTRSPATDAAFREVRSTVARLRQELRLDERRRRWPVSRERFEEADRFRYVAETSVHSVEEGNAARLVGFLLSEGSVMTLLERVPEEAVGLDRLRLVAAQELGDDLAPWYVGYRAWLAIR